MIGFWAFMLLMDLLVPLVMIGFGKLFLSKAPRNINRIFGYRTEMSMKNQDTWQFAHNYCGKLWFWLGWILLPLSAAPLLFVFGKDIAVIGTAGGIVCVVQLLPLAGSIFVTERALKKAFDRHGRRKGAAGPREL